MKKLTLAALSIVSISVVAGIYSYTYDETIASEPMSITIESESLGINAKADVAKVYESRKISLKENLDNEIKKEADADSLAALKYTYDSLDCMESSMNQYPKLMEVIDGGEKSAQTIYKEMEGNCVEDVLFYLKTNHPNKFPIAQKAFIESGFVVPKIED